MTVAGLLFFKRRAGGRLHPHPIAGRPRSANSRDAISAVIREADGSTDEAIHTDFLTLTATPLALSHAIIAVGAYNTVSTTVSAYLNVAKDGSSLAEVVREAPNTAGWQDAGLAQRATLAAQSTTWKWRARAETAGTTVNADELAIAVLQLGATAAASVRRRYMALAG